MIVAHLATENINYGSRISSIDQKFEVANLSAINGNINSLYVNIASEKITIGVGHGYLLDSYSQSKSSQILPSVF